VVIVRTPVRISFVGGGTDLKDYWSKNGGGVISTTIDKYVYAIVKRRFDNDICINYTKRENVKRPDDIQHDLVREAMRMTGVDRGVEITTLADIPSEGSGLGSSSSITVALLHALYSYRGELISAECLARDACEIEIDILGSPIGIQDQYIAAYGGLRHLNFEPDSSVGIEKLELNGNDKRKFKSCLHLFYLNRTRKANDILKEQKAGIEDNLKTLDSMRDMVLPFKESLLNYDFDRSGQILHEGWLKKKTLASSITQPEIDGYYEAALEAGALGGKVTGAGGGGFLLLYCPLHKRKAFLEKMWSLGLTELPFKLEHYGSRVIFSHNDSK
jgi:D-glycero-alpha-D-manno-heptose-7-phosphate kinase